jgi:hypothetical protein
VALMPCPIQFTPGNDLVHVVWEAGWTSEAVWIGVESHITYTVY